jgi:hypothetical protein
MESRLACLYIIPKGSGWPPNAEARPYTTLNNPLNILPFTQIIFHIEPFMHLGPRPSLPKCGNRVAHLRARHKAVTTKVVVILLLSGSLRLIRQLMDVAETFCIWFQSLAPHGPYKDHHLDDNFGSKLMKANFEGSKDFNQQFIQRKPKPAFMKLL